MTINNQINGKLTDGQLMIGSSVGAPAPATITAGSNITVTNGHNTITIASSGGTSTVNLAYYTYFGGL